MADKGYHSGAVAKRVKSYGVRSYISEKKQKGRRHWAGKADQERIEECFGWLKTIALLRKVRDRGLGKVDWVFVLACAAYNLVRLRNLSTQPA